MHCLRAVFIVFTLIFASASLGQTTVTLQQGLNGYTGSADNWIASGNADVNKGTGLDVELRAASDYGLYRFNIFQSEGGPVPNGATITSATLSVYKYAGPDGVFKASRLLKSWTETGSTWNATGNGTPWSTPGAQGAGTDVLASADGQGSVPDAAVNNCGDGIGHEICWLNIDVTSGVQAFANGTALNFGWLLQQVSSSSPSAFKDFNSRDITNFPQYRPKLAITYATSSCSSGVSRPYDGAPVSGNPIQIASTGATVFEAENFNCGGEGVAYHDNVAGNAGGQYRPAENVDIIASLDAAGGGYAVNNFETGEWLSYTINVAAAGSYDIAIRAANNLAAAAFHIEIDGNNVTGSVAVPVTGSWSAFNWFTASGVPLAAGQHVLKLQTDQQYFDVNQIRSTFVSPAVSCGSGSLRPYDGAPVNGAPIAIASTGATVFEAENFNCGGEGAAYHDNVAGNAGGQYRPAENVDIVTSLDAAGGGYVVNNFETGEWLAYTINVATAGTYDLAVRAANNLSPSSFHIEIDGTNVTGSVTVPVTGSWGTFNWFGVSAVPLAAGQHVLKLVSDLQYFDVNQLRLTFASTDTGGSGSTDCGTTSLCIRFEANPDTKFDCIDFPCTSGRNQVLSQSTGGVVTWFAQNKNLDHADDTSRVNLVAGGRDGSTAIKLTTLENDNSVHGSGTDNERSELQMDPAATAATEGKEQWWGHSLFLPANAPFPAHVAYQKSLIFQFHHTRTDRSQANVTLNLFYEPTTLRTIILARGDGELAGGGEGPQYTYTLGSNFIKGHCLEVNPQANTWYDFVHHFRWSSNGTGFHEIWMRAGNGTPKKVMDMRNISTLYAGDVAYMKVGLYHPVMAGSNSMIHDRIRRGNSFAEVANFPQPPAPDPVVSCPGDP